MGFMDKAKEMLGQHDDKVDQGLDKVGEKVTEKYGHGDQVDKGVDFLQERTGEGDTTAAPPAAPEGEQPPPPPA
ncbi:MAG: antitoxin [Pseudonocardia sp.]|nr:antitoxin [Pseudonocardia sp.]